MCTFRVEQKAGWVWCRGLIETGSNQYEPLIHPGRVRDVWFCPKTSDDPTLVDDPGSTPHVSDRVRDRRIGSPCAMDLPPKWSLCTRICSLDQFAWVSITWLPLHHSKYNLLGQFGRLRPSELCKKHEQTLLDHPMECLIWTGWVNHPTSANTGAYKGHASPGDVKTIPIKLVWLSLKVGYHRLPKKKYGLPRSPQFWENNFGGDPCYDNPYIHISYHWFCKIPHDIQGS